MRNGNEYRQEMADGDRDGQCLGFCMDGPLFFYDTNGEAGNQDIGDEYGG